MMVGSLCIARIPRQLKPKSKQHNRGRDMKRSERRRQDRENRGQGKAIGLLYSASSHSIQPVVQQFILEHEGHTIDVDDNLKNSLTLSCADCEDVDEIGEG